jgi:drug/metabolite transporter (DMT)-like permease
MQKLKIYFADLGLLYAAAIWGTTFFIIKGILPFIDPVLLVGYRVTSAALILLVIILWQRKKPFSNLKLGFILGLVLWLLFIAQTIGLKYTSASNSGFITGLFVIFVPLFSFLFFNKIPTLRRSIAVLISVIGLWFLVGGFSKFNIGDLLTLFCAMFYAAHILLADRYVRKNIDPYVLCFQQFLWMGIFSFASALIFHLPFKFDGYQTWWVIAYLVLFPTLSAFLIQLLAQKYTAPIKVSLIFALEPVFGAMFSWTLGGEQFLINHAIGGFLIFVAMILAGL